MISSASDYINSSSHMNGTSETNGLTNTVREAQLVTFTLPLVVTGSDSDIQLGKAMVAEWQKEGMFQVARTADEDLSEKAAMKASRAFVEQPWSKKAACISDLSFAGYVGSGEEVTGGKPDQSEIFTITKDLSLDDKRVKNGWPCHGPVPWPSQSYKEALSDFLSKLGSIGDRLLQLIALGLNLPDMNTLKSMTNDGWHHARVLHFPRASIKTARGIGAHTDYGLLVIATQDDVGGLFIRPPIEGEVRKRNWLPSESAAGMYENSEEWNFVKPVPSVVTVFPGDMFQLLTDGAILSTPHKVRLAEKDRYAIAYFHEPNFQQIIKPINNTNSKDFVHYGEHFTNMYLRCYPDRITSKRIERENRMDTLAKLKKNVMANFSNRNI